MKIVHVVDSMEIGGAETLVAQMCLAQRAQGHDPRVYAIASLGPLGEQLRHEGFEVHANMARRLHDAIPAFYRAFRDSCPDVVHLHNPAPTIYAAAAARVAKVPSIVSTRHSLIAPPRRPSVELRYGIAAAFCDWIVGICDATVQNLKSLHTIPMRKIVRVYNGTLPIELVSLERRPAKSGFTLLFVGRLAPVKNLPLLLNAFHAALASRSDLRLWIVGEGSERAALEYLAKKLGICREVTFWGQQLDVAPFFSAADVFVMSSVSEGLPISLLQAFSTGLPAVVSDVGGMAEVVRSGQCGLVVGYAHDGAFAEGLVRMSSEENERRLFSERSRNTFQRNYHLSVMLDSYFELYRKGHARRCA